MCQVCLRIMVDLVVNTVVSNVLFQVNEIA